MKKILVTFLLLCGLVYASPFDQGKTNFSITASKNGLDTILGIGANFFLFDGLSVGAEYRGTFGDDNSRNDINIPVSYYLRIPGPIRPYVGGFYRVSIDDNKNNDYETYGGRVGISTSRGNGYLNVGYIQEWQNRGGEVHTNGRPEISGGISF